MILTLQNKITMAIDRMIEDAINLGGIPKNILLDTNEAVTFLQEIYNTKNNANVALYTDDTRVLYSTVFSRFGTKKEIYNFIQKYWYTRRYRVIYKDVELIIVKPKKRDTEIQRFNCYGTIK